VGMVRRGEVKTGLLSFDVFCSNIAVFVAA
jgi:hypothetical protein